MPRIAEATQDRVAPTSWAAGFFHAHGVVREPVPDEPLAWLRGQPKGCPYVCFAGVTPRVVWFGQVVKAMGDPNCLFCRIIRGEIPSKKVHEDEFVFAFEDVNPQAPTHVLIIPKRHFAGLKEAQEGDAEIIGRCHLAAAQIARQRNIEKGYRTVLNVGPGAGQSVFHLHVHLLGGRPLTWPPG